MSSSDEEVSNLMKPADQEDVGSDPGLMPERSESERGLGSGKTAAEEQVEVCRYCLEEAPKNELFRPCQCTNPVHTSCLRRWLTTGPSQVRLKCELCNGAIEAKQELAAYSVLIKDKEGRSILLATLLRLAYRLFLCRRLLTRYSFCSLPHPPSSSLSPPLSLPQPTQQTDTDTDFQDCKHCL